MKWDTNSEYRQTMAQHPARRLLRTRDVVKEVPFRVVDYCQYADERFALKARKRTAIWANTEWQLARKLCQKDCG